MTLQPRSQKSGSLKHECLLLVMSMIWGSTFAVQQIGISKGFEPMTFNALRFALGFMVLVPIILRRKAESQPFTCWRGAISAGVFLFLAAGLQQMGLEYTSSANAGFITALYIIFVPMLGLPLGHKATRSLWSGAAICLVGLYLLSFNETMTISKGDLLILLCAFLWAAQILTIDHVATDSDPYKIAAVQFAVCAILSGLVAACFESLTMETLSSGGWTVLYAGFLSVGVAFTLQVVCQKHCPPGHAAVIMSLEAVFAAIAGYLILGQTLTTRSMLGCILIFLGVLIAQLVPLIKRSRRQHST